MKVNIAIGLVRPDRCGYEAISHVLIEKRFHDKM